MDGRKALKDACVEGACGLLPATHSKIKPVVFNLGPLSQLMSARAHNVIMRERAVAPLVKELEYL